MLVHEQSKGIARTINVICDNALLTAMAVGKRMIDREIVREVVRDFDLEPSDRGFGTAAAGTPERPFPSVAVDPAETTTAATAPSGDQAVESASPHRGLFVRALNGRSE